MRKLLLPIGGKQLRFVSDRVDVVSQSKRHHVSFQAVDDRASLFARAAVRLIDDNFLTRFAFPVFCERAVELLVEFPSWVVRDVHQSDRLGGRPRGLVGASGEWNAEGEENSQGYKLAHIGHS